VDDLRDTKVDKDLLEVEVREVSHTLQIRKKAHFDGCVLGKLPKL
jgi:hypothetical protein